MKIRAKIVLMTSIIIIIAIGFQAVYNILSTSSSIEKIVESQLGDQIMSIESQILVQQEVVQITKSAMNEKNVSLAQAIAEMVTYNPSWLKTYNMDKLADQLKINEIRITNLDGVVEFGNNEKSFGTKLTDDPSSEPFMDLVTNKNGFYAQEPAPRAEDGKMYQFVGVPRRDVPGVVQIGIQSTPSSVGGIIWAKEVEDYQRYGVIVTNPDGTMARIVAATETCPCVRRKATSLGLASR